MLSLKSFVRFSGIFFLFLFTISSCRQTTNTPGNSILLTDWKVQSAAKATGSGKQISTSEFSVSGWYDTNVPSTVLAALVQNGLYKNPYYAKNLEKIPTEIFAGSWWYRTEFNLPDLEQLPLNILRFNGINYSANVWLNGEKILQADSIFGAFRTFEKEISPLVREQGNILAVQVFPPQPGDFTIGFVDWNPAPPDKNMGLWREVQILRNRGLRIKSAFVRSKINLPQADEAELSIEIEVENYGAQTVQGKIAGKIETVAFSLPVEFFPKESKTFRITAENFPQLRIKNPRLWWPHQFGYPNLYTLNLDLETDGRISDNKQVRFGIRQIEKYFTKEGYTAFKINGKKIQIRGGGWVDDLLLADSPQKLEAQIQYVKHMNLNTIRLEGFWGKDHLLYDLCDRYGILIMAGWSCHWEWPGYLGKACDKFGGVKSEQDMRLVSQYWNDQIKMFRNHPCIFVWLGGSDMLPRPGLEKRYQEILREIDPDRPYLGSAADLNSEISGPTGVKMNGPYDYVPPVYWYADTAHGGAFGFNTESGPGPQPPPIESLKRMMPEENLWPIDDMWNYLCGRNEFNSLDRYTKALNARYGKSASAEEYTRKAQLANYEAMRAMFEAFAVNKFRATGIIQWMLNSAWPEMYWQLYDYYLMPNGAFYGAKKAGAPVQLIYNYANHKIYLNNEQLQKTKQMQARIRLFDLQSIKILDKTLAVNISANRAREIFALPGIKNDSPLYFLDLRLFDDQQTLLENNFYWLSAKKDELDFPASKWFVTPQKAFADFTELENLKKVQLKSTVSYAEENNRQKVLVKLENSGNGIAFFVRLLLTDKKGQPLLPVFWSDNYVSLLPGESRMITVEYDGELLNDKKPLVQISGINIK